MPLPRIPTFEELLKKVKQPKVPEIEDIDATQASELGYNLPPNWRLQRLEGVDSLISPRGLTFRDLKMDEGKITDFQAFRGDKPVRLPQPIVELPPEEPPPEPPPEEPPTEFPPLDPSRVIYRRPSPGEEPVPTVPVSLIRRAEESRKWLAFKLEELQDIPWEERLTEIRRQASEAGITLPKEYQEQPREQLGPIETLERVGETVIGAVKAPLFEIAGVPISAGDITALALIAFNVYQVGIIGWNILLDRVLRKPSDLNWMGRQLTRAALNRNLSIYERQTGVKIPPETRNNFINRYLSDMSGYFRQGVESQAQRGAMTVPMLQSASQAVYKQTADIVNREIGTLIPQAAQTGITMGGLAAEGGAASIQSVVQKIIANQSLNLEERQLYANQSQAVEAALKAQVTPTEPVTPVTPEVPAVGEVTSESWVSMPVAERTTLVTSAGLKPNIARKTFDALTTEEFKAMGVPAPIKSELSSGVPAWQVSRQTYNKWFKEQFKGIEPANKHKDIVSDALAKNEQVPTEVLAEYPDLAPTPPAVEVAKPPVAELAEQLKAKLAKEPVAKPPTPKAPVERRTEIQSLLKEPAKNLPKGTTKIVLRKELAQINKSLVPQEKKLRSQIMATVRNKGIGKTQMRDIFRKSGGSRYLTNQELTELEKTLKAVEKARPITIKGKKVITVKREDLIKASKKDLVDQGILTEKTYKDILESLKLSTDKYVSPQKFITNAEGGDIIRAMRNTAILNPLGELKFGKPTALKYLTSQTYYAQVLGLKPLTNPLELAKVDFDLANRAMANAVDQKLRGVNKAWGVSTREVISAKAKNVPTKGSVALRDLLDKHEEAPVGLTDKQKELFNWFRNLNRSIIDGENEVRRAMGVEEISYRQAYVRHIPDVMARNIMEGTHPIPPNLLYWSKRLVGKKIFNPMELHRQLSDDLANIYSKDLAFATKSMVYTGLKEIHLAQPLRAFTERMGALSDVMPATTRKWVTDYVNQVIKGQQTEFDESINAIVTESGLGGLIDRVLRPFNRTLGNRPVSKVTRDIGTATIYSVLALPRPRLLRLMIRNLFQRTQELALHGVTPTLKSFLPDPRGLKELKGESRYLRSYTGIEEFPTDLLSKLKKIPLAPYQFTATLNASRGMSAAYHDYIKFFENKKHKDLGWASEQRTYTEEKGFLYPEEQKLMLEEMELATRATQYQYIGIGMPEIFRHKTLIPITRLQSWWMNHFTMFHREAFHRFATGETRAGQKLPWSSRLNWLKYLLLGGAILTAMGYGASFGVKVLPHNESPFTQFAVGLAKYVSADSDWEREQAKRSMYYSWKAIVPGALAYDEFEKIWSGETPIWQMFWYGSEEEGAPPRIPDWSLPIETSKEAKPRIENLMDMLGGFDQAELDARLKVATDAEASSARIAEIKAGEYPYDITSLRRDMADVTENLSEKDIAKLEPIASSYVEFKAQDKEYSLLSDFEQEKYIKDNPDYTTNRLFWGDNNLVTIPDLKTADALEAQARKYNIPLDMIPAFQKTDDGKERIPSDRNLWEHYFYYYDLPGTSYLNMTQGQVDDGQLPEKYRDEWEAYQRLKTDFAKTSYRKAHKEAAYSKWREDFRRANLEFDQWLIDQKYNKPLAKVTIRRPTRATIAPVETIGFGAARPRRAAPTYPTFPKPRTGISVGAPTVPGF